MKTFSRLWQYLSEFFLEWEMLKKVVEKIKTQILYSVTSFRKSYHLWDNVENCDGARGTINDVTIWRIRFPDWSWSPPSLPFKVVSGSFPARQASGREVHHSPSSNAEVKSEKSYSSTPLICLNDVKRDNFTVCLCRSIDKSFASN